MPSELRGLPLLSGSPPSPPYDISKYEPVGCRKCSKEFNLFTRAKKCSHCGFSYCNNCNDYEALMPRSSPSGYSRHSVCGFCIDVLTVTAAGRAQLKGYTLARLKAYVQKYNITLHGAVDKDDFVDAIMSARRPNGCLSATHEQFYRDHSVPDRSGGLRARGLFSSLSSDPPVLQQPRVAVPVRSNSIEFARPDLEPGAVPPPATSTSANDTRNYSDDSQPVYPPYTPREYPATPHSRYDPRSDVPPPPPRRPTPVQTPQQQPSRSPPNHPRPNPHQASHPRNTPPRANPNTRPNQQSRPPQPPPRPSPPPPPAAPTPTLLQLVTMSDSDIASLSIGKLKSILMDNHVHPGLILEKAELVTKVQFLVTQERLDRERQRQALEREEEELQERQRENQREREESLRRRAEREAGSEGGSGRAGGNEGPAGNGLEASMPPPSPPSQHTPHVERTGLCVVCQDEEANMVTIDCGHLAMCRECANLVMTSSRECPLCRTRIITEARLLRVFKT